MFLIIITYNKLIYLLRFITNNILTNPYSLKKFKNYHLKVLILIDNSY